MLTAKHIVKDLAAAPRRFDNTLGRMVEVWDCFAAYPGDAGLWPGNDGARLFPSTVSIPSRGDIAILQLHTSGDSAPPGPFQSLYLHLGLPAVGGTVYTFCYHRLRRTTSAETATELALHLSAGAL